MEQLLALKVHIPMTVSAENYYSDRKVIAKILIIDLAAGTMALRLMTGCSYRLHKTKSKHNSPLSDQTRQDKPLNNFSDAIPAGQPRWSTEVAEL